MSITQKRCTEELCERKYYARGYCLYHYNKNRLSGVLENKKCFSHCRIDRCDGAGVYRKETGKSYFNKGYCNKHYLRLIRYGDPLAGGSYRITDVTRCKVKDCQREYYGKYYCAYHYLIAKRNNWKIPQYLRSTERPAIIEGDIAMIPLGINAKDGYALVDKEFAYADKYKWSKMKIGYAVTSIKNRRIMLHHFVYGKPPKGLVTDHINRNKLDNRKENLRHVTQHINMLNTDRHDKC